MFKFMRKKFCNRISWLLTLSMCLTSFSAGPCSTVKAAETKNSDFTLTAVSDAASQTVKLNWDAPDNENDYSYTEYIKNSDDSQFHAATRRNIKILQVYPGSVNRCNLQKWITKAETNQSLNNTSFINDKISMTSDAVSITAFNENPDVLSKYDVVAFGFSDEYENGCYDLNASSESAVENYIKEGHGVLFGHNTIFSGYEDSENSHTYFNKLANMCNILMNRDTLNCSFEDYSSRANAVDMKKQGDLTSYPYSFDSKSLLPIRETHNCAQIPSFNDIWFSFADNGDYYNENYNSYLSTFDNTALIQIGHDTSLKANDYKILMNTLYYLAQNIKTTSWTDTSFADTIAPEKPVLNDITYDSKHNAIILDASSTDKGSNYEYYIKASYQEEKNPQTEQDTSADNYKAQEGYVEKDVKTLESNHATASTSSGIKGYSIVVDHTPDTEPSNTTNSINGNFAFPTDSNFLNSTEPIYVHIKAIDGCGNVSETLHYQYNRDITVTFDTQGSYSKIPVQTVTRGETATQPESPKKSGYCFSGWYTDSDCTEAFDFSTPIITDTILYAKWSSYPALLLNNGTISAVQDDENIPIVSYVLGIASSSSAYENLQSKASIKGDAVDGVVTLDKPGIYTFYVTDDNGNRYYLKANYSNGRLIDLSALYDEIEYAQYLYDNTPELNDDLRKGDAYTTKDAKDKLLAAIKNATADGESASDADVIESIYTTLQKAILTFKDSMIFYQWSPIKVIGSNIYAEPQNDNYEISKVCYNVDENKNLVQGIYGNWVTLTAHPYDTKTADYEWDNVADGIYTMFVSIKNKETGTKSFYYELAVVATNSDPAVLAKDFTKSVYDETAELMSTLKREKEASKGDQYISTVRYNYVISYLDTLNKQFEDSSISYDTWVSTAYTLTDLLQSIKGEIKTMTTDGYEAPTDELVISVSGPTVKFSRSNLSRVFVAKGDYSDAGFVKKVKCTEKQASQGSASLRMGQIGIYTALVRYSDEAQEVVHFEITDLQGTGAPTLSISLSLSDDGKIIINKTGNATVAYTSYAYGDYETDSKLAYQQFNGFQEELPAMGNGIHSVCIRDINGNLYYAKINVTTLTEPTVVEDDYYITPYTYGFNIKIAAYAPGNYSSWADMTSEAVYINQNKAITKSTFDDGEYTFYFEAEDGTAYFKHITIGDDVENAENTAETTEVTE